MPPADPDAADFARLRGMYKRYMLRGPVARWLLRRDAPSDFHAVRKETAVQLCVSSASPPEVLPESIPDAPFPAADDLLFLDRNEHGFALGHIWGSVQTEAHPYAALAARAGKSGWNRVRSRKFASDLTVSDAVESVEYCWFTDNSAIVVLSRVPIAPSKRKIRISEILFFPPVQRLDIPPQRPELVLLVHDRAVCPSCSNEICACPNTLGVARGTIAALSAKSSCSSPSSTAPCIKMSWELRMRMMFHGNKRGLLTVVYSSSVAAAHPRITVRQAYMSTCASQDQIADRIQQQLTKLLAKVPRPDQGHPRAVAMESSVPPATAPQTAAQIAMSCAADLGQSPVSFTPSPVLVPTLPRESIWFEPPKAKAPSVPCNPELSPCDADKCGDHKSASVSKSASSQHDVLEVEQAAMNASAISLPSVKSGAESFSRDMPMQSTLCGPEKAGVDCDCSAEKMQDPSLALILNSRRDLPAANPMAEMGTFIEPIMEGSSAKNNANSLLEQSIPNLGHSNDLNMLRDDEKNGLDNFVSTVRFGSQSPDSGRLGGVTALPSPLPPPPPMGHDEPPLKRPRADTAPKTDAFALGLDAGWPGPFDEHSKGVHLPSWNIHAIPERPLSALGRALGVARSPSPLALMNGVHKTPSPSGLALSGPTVPTLAFPKLVNQEPSFQNQFDANGPTNQVESVTEREAKGSNNVTLLVAKKVAAKGDSSPPGDSRNTSEGAVTNGSEASAGNGVCCEICGISFAKRSNKLRHIQTVHNRLKQFECDLCGTKFGLKADLGRHRFRIHESRAYCCKTCGKSFAEQGQLELHIRVTHEEDSRPWECKRCRIRFGRKSSLTRHEQTVHQQTRFACRVCKKSYSQKFDAFRHEQKIHGLTDKPT